MPTDFLAGSQDTLPPRSNKIPVSQWPRTGAGLVVEPLGWSVNIPPASDIRTAVYAIERLQSSWDFSHAAGIYISGIVILSPAVQLIIELVACRNRHEYAVVRRGGMYRVDFYQHHPTPSPPGRFPGYSAAVQTITGIQ